jgi:hypothetical protein
LLKGIRIGRGKVVVIQYTGRRYGRYHGVVSQGVKIGVFDVGEKLHSLGLELVRSDDTRQAQQLAVDRDDVFGDVETFSYIPHDR